MNTENEQVSLILSDDVVDLVNNLEVIIECVKLMDGNGYKVQLVKGENIVNLDCFHFGSIALDFAQRISEMTGYEMYTVEEFVSTRVLPLDQFLDK